MSWEKYSQLLVEIWEDVIDYLLVNPKFYREKIQLAANHKND